MPLPTCAVNWLQGPGSLPSVGPLILGQFQVDQLDPIDLEIFVAGWRTFRLHFDSRGGFTTVHHGLSIVLGAPVMWPMFGWFAPVLK